MKTISDSRAMAIALVMVAMSIHSCSPPKETTGTESEPGAAPVETFFMERCGVCHGSRGEGRAEQEVPSIAGLPDWYLKAQIEKFADGSRSYVPQDGEGQRMKLNAHLLPAAETDDLVAHIAGLPAVPTENTLGGSPVRGQELYQQWCESCHFSKGQGDYAFKTPPLTISPDWYLAAQLEKFRMRERGGHLRDPKGPEMLEPAARFANGEQQRDVLAYIAFLAGWRKNE